MTTNLILIAGCDEVARGSATSSLLCDLPDCLVIQYDLNAEGELWRRGWDGFGLVTSHSLTLGHSCVSCAASQDLVPALIEALEQRWWTTIVVSLPLTAAPESVAWQISEAIRTGDLDAKLCAVLAVAEETTLVADIFGDDLLADRGLHLSEFDDRAMGEAICAQLDFADVIATLGTPDQMTAAVLEHLTGDRPRREIHSLDAGELITRSHDFKAAQTRTDPTGDHHHRSADCCGVWTLVLTSDRPLHPGRLYAQVELIGAGRLRSKGLTWVPSRPEMVVAWDGAGGQLSIGDAGVWAGDKTRHTRLVITGIDEADRGRVERAFNDILLTDWELSLLDGWDCDDGLDLWLGTAD